MQLHIWTQQFWLQVLLILRGKYPNLSWSKITKTAAKGDVFDTYYCEKKGILTCQDVREYVKLWSDSSGGKGILNSQKIKVWLQLWKDISWISTAVKRKLSWLVWKSGYIWNWSMEGDDLHIPQGSFQSEVAISSALLLQGNVTVKVSISPQLCPQVVTSSVLLC